jgi:FemAB-related protein (PEP-CTERM system-associated)
MEPIDVRPSRPDDDDLRDRHVRAHDRGTFFHLAGWRRVIERVFRHEARDLVAYRGDELVGVLPMMRVPGMLGGSKLISIPYGVYGGPIGDDAHVEQALLDEAVRIADNLRVGHLELRYRDDPGPDLVGSDLYYTFIRDLPEKAEDVLAGMPKKARADARKARKKHGLTMTHGSWYVEDLYRFFVRNKHSLGSPALPASLFHELLQEFGDLVTVHLVRRDREPLAAVMAFSDGDTLIAYYSGTVAGADREYKASNYMYLALQEWAVEQGFRKFDFGRSRADAGAFQFKRHQGFEPEPLHYRYHLVQNRRVPSFTPSNPKTALLRETWKRLPNWCVPPLSARLARYLP